MAKNDELNPYVIGVGEEGWAAKTQYEYFNFHRLTFVHQKPREHFIKEEIQLNDGLGEYHINIQQEMLVYLKFWESDFILKQLYNLSHRLLHGSHYDWHIDLRKSGRKNLIENQIIDSCKRKSPKFHSYISSAYNRQIRNAVAHSQFYLIDDRIHFNNHDPSDNHCLKVLKIVEWERFFHRTIAFYNSLIGCSIRYELDFKEKARKNESGISLRVTKLNKEESVMTLNIENDRWRIVKVEH